MRWDDEERVYIKKQKRERERKSKLEGKERHAEKEGEV